MEILMALAREIVEKDMKIEDAIVQIDDQRIDLSFVRDELKSIESLDVLNEEEYDALKNLLVYMCLKNTNHDLDDIYAMIFGSGRGIIWN